MNRNKEIFSVGEILYDCYPEYRLLGGAPFNFIYHIMRLTGKGKFISRVGNDEAGLEALDFLSLSGFDTSLIQIDGKHNTGKVKVELGENKIPQFIIEKNAAYDYIETNHEDIESVKQNASMIYFGTLAQRSERSRNSIQKFIGLNLPLFYDINLRQNFYTKDILEYSLKKSTVAKLNEDELKIVNDLFFQAAYDISEISKMVMTAFKIELLCVTLGEDGAVLFSDNNKSIYKHKAEKIIDTVGAGDAYAAVLCLGYLMNWELSRINSLASKFASEICGIEGAVPHNKNFYNKYTEIIENG